MFKWSRVLTFHHPKCVPHLPHSGINSQVSELYMARPFPPHCIQHCTTLVLVCELAVQIVAIQPACKDKFHVRAVCKRPIEALNPLLRGYELHH